MRTLIIGGAGSGKSAFAEAHVCRLAGRRIYLATMTARDDESLLRIARHRLQRADSGFETLERGLGLADAEIPEGCLAQVILPGGGDEGLFGPGRHAFEESFV